KVFPTGNNERIVASSISHRIVMKPVLPTADEAAWIISTGAHGVGDDLVHIPSLTDAAVLTDLQDNTFDVGISVYFEEQAKFAGVNIVMQVSYTDTPVVGDKIDRPI